MLVTILWTVFEIFFAVSGFLGKPSPTKRDDFFEKLQMGSWLSLMIDKKELLTNGNVPPNAPSEYLDFTSLTFLYESFLPCKFCTH